MTTTRNIPLKQLSVWDGNVRKTEGSDTGLAELAASIQSVGIINPLTVFQDGEAFYVVAGGRRLAALNALLSRNVVDNHYPVPCVLTNAADATEISIAENTIREDMHPADEFEAFLKLSKAGISNEDIAAKFGVTKTVVEKRLRLARVSPKIIAAYREGTIDLECVMAYAVTDDVKRQLRVFKALSGYHAADADSIRSALTEDEIDASDKRVRFVTLKTYEKAGGRTRRDLFADEKDASGIYIIDVGLLDSLVTKKLEKAAAAVRKEGWHWVEVRTTFGYDDKSKFRQLRETESDLAPELQAEVEALETERDELYDIDELTDEQSDRIDAIESRLGEIDADRETVWPDGTFDIAGAVVTLGYHGEADIERGLVRPEDARKLAKAQGEKSSTGDDEPGLQAETPVAIGLPAKLVEQLTRQRTAALAAELIDKPAIGLATIAYCLALDTFGSGARTCVHIDMRKQSHQAVEGSPAHERIERARDHWGETVPGTPEALWDWCLEQHVDVLVDLVTFCAAMSIDAVVRKRGSMDSRTDLSHADDLAIETGLDMKTWFTPTAANYFGHISKGQILAALSEVKGSTSPAWHKAKKSELAAIAERETAGTGWLPEILRTPDDSAQELEEAA